MSEPMLRLVGGRKKIPDTYLQTLAAEDAARTHREKQDQDQRRENQHFGAFDRMKAH